MFDNILVGQRNQDFKVRSASRKNTNGLKDMSQLPATAAQTRVIVNYLMLVSLSNFTLH